MFTLVRGYDYEAPKKKVVCQYQKLKRILVAVMLRPTCTFLTIGSDDFNIFKLGKKGHYNFMEHGMFIISILKMDAAQ